MKDPDLYDSSTRGAKLFRRRFRVPLPLFEIIVQKYKNGKVFNPERKSNISIEFKVMIAIRIFGRDVCADEVSELSFVPERTVNRIFKDFVANFSRLLEKEVVKLPEGEKLRKTMNVYSKLGFPGAVASMDCTHIKWSQCPDGKKHLATGKESFPSLVFQCAVTHDRYIVHCSKAFYGGYNDITVTHNESGFVQDVLNGSLEHLEYVLYDSNKIPQRCKGGWIIVDGGYPKNGYLIHPKKNRIEHQEIIFGEWMESTRKDVECVFGILKQRLDFFVMV